MYEGKIIKFYRMKSNLTQEQLGKDICSVTHISKIERGMTEHSQEIITLLADNLGIDLQKELDQLKSIEKHLQLWQESIIMHHEVQADKIKAELEKIPLIEISDYKLQYQLILARHFILKEDSKDALKIIKNIKKNYNKLPQYESNLFLHVQGLYSIKAKDYHEAVSLLKTISDDYKNYEYYYNLALAYHYINFKVMSYFYAEKALQYFKSTNNFLRIMDTEILMLIQIGDNEHYNFEETVAHYETLIRSCELYHFHRQKGMLLHNLAFKHYNRKMFEPASKIYQESMLVLNDETDSLYLRSFEGYIRCSLEGRLIGKQALLELAEQGLSMAKRIKDTFPKTLFTILLLEIKNNLVKYYEYIHHQALPYFRNNGCYWLIKPFGRKLFHFYSETNQLTKAVEIASEFIE